MCFNQVCECVYPVGGDVKEGKRKWCFWVVRTSTPLPPLPIVVCAARNCQYDFSFFLVLCRPLKNIIKSINVSPL